MTSFVSPARAAAMRGLLASINGGEGPAQPVTVTVDCRPDASGLDDGPFLPGRGPRRTPPPKSAAELAAIRAKAWTTRRARYGTPGHR